MKTSGSLWNYYGDELADEENDGNNLSENVVDSKYKTNITESTYNLAATAAGYDANKEGIKET